MPSKKSLRLLAWEHVKRELNTIAATYTTGSQEQEDVNEGFNWFIQDVETSGILNEIKQKNVRTRNAGKTPKPNRGV